MSKSHAGMGGSTAAARRAPGWYDDVAPQSSFEEGARRIHTAAAAELVYLLRLT